MKGVVIVFFRIANIAILACETNHFEQLYQKKVKKYLTEGAQAHTFL